MRTTLDIDDDIWVAAKELARQQNISAGQVVSRLLRRVLTGQHNVVATDAGLPTVAGFRPFPAGNNIVSNEVVNKLREVEGV